MLKSQKLCEFAACYINRFIDSSVGIAAECWGYLCYTFGKR